jgi:hypothetical protein
MVTRVFAAGIDGLAELCQHALRAGPADLGCRRELVQALSAKDSPLHSRTRSSLLDTMLGEARARARHVLTAEDSPAPFQSAVKDLHRQLLDVRRFLRALPRE